VDGVEAEEMSRRFTGVTDINGRKIYTGDIVKMHYFYEAHDYHTLGAYEGEAEVVGRVGHCWEKFYTEQEERHYYNGKLETVYIRYYWDKYLQEPEEELEIIGGVGND
jgi:hypothetical protein